jgi:hypothetical protein
MEATTEYFGKRFFINRSSLTKFYAAHLVASKLLVISVDADPDPIFYCDADPDPIFYCDADPDPSFQIKAQNLEKVLKKAHIPHILACHLQN